MPVARSSLKGSDGQQDSVKAAEKPKKGGSAAASLSKGQGDAVSPKRSTGVTVTSAGGCGVLSMLAKDLREPYRTIFIACSPALATLSARYSPIAVDWSVGWLKGFSKRHTARKAVKKLKSYVKAETKRLANDKSLNDTNRAEILRYIEDANRKISKAMQANAK